MNSVKKEDLVKDSIINDYIRYVEYLDSHNYHREIVTVHELLSNIVTVNNLKKNNDGMIIDVLCPPGIIISIQGIQCLPEDYQIEKIPPFEMVLTNLQGEELGPDAQIKIFKKKILRKPEEIFEIQYKDISMTNYSESPNKFKTYNNLFRFNQCIELKGEDHLKFYVINPNIDIDKIKFNMNVDLWTPLD